MRNLIKLTSEELQEIDRIAELRFKNAKRSSKQYTYGNKPAPKTHKRDILGLSGEWAVKKFLLKQSKKYNFEIEDDTTKDFTAKKSKDDYYDFLISLKGLSVSLEVKTTTCLFHAHLLIPKHRKKCWSDYYCLVKKLNKDTYEICGFAPHIDVFKVFDTTRASPCYSMHEDLLKSFEETLFIKGEN